MRRAVAAAALIGLGALAPPAQAAPDRPGASAAPARAAPKRASATRAAVSAGLGDLWTEPAGTFSFELPKGWRDVDTASEVGAPTLELVTGDGADECWFTRVSSPSTAALAPSLVIRARMAPLSAATWERVASQQHVIAGAVELREASVGVIGVWPVQMAWFSSGGKDVFAALHSRPGLDIWVFCSVKSRDDSDAARAVALSVRTPRDDEWEREIGAHANLTAVP